jgi:hypothetical protein
MGMARYFGSGRLMYKTGDLYINKTLGINTNVLLNVRGFLVYDMLRSLLAFEICAQLLSGGLLLLYWELGKPGQRPDNKHKNRWMRVYARNWANQIEYVWP